MKLEEKKMLLCLQYKLRTSWFSDMECPYNQTAKDIHRGFKNMT